MTAPTLPREVESRQFFIVILGIKNDQGISVALGWEIAVNDRWLQQSFGLDSI